MWRLLFLSLLAVLGLGCGVRAGGLELETSATSSSPGTITCQERGMKLLIKTAEFSPASEKFCNRSCQPVLPENSTTKCIPVRENGRSCKRTFAAEEVGKLYKKCQEPISQGLPCHLDHVEGLSQTHGAIVQYFCLKSTKDPCDVSTTGETGVLYHDLSSPTHRRQCICTAEVGFLETEREFKMLLIRYLHFVNTPDYSDLPEGMASVTLTSSQGEDALNISTTPELMLTRVYRSSPMVLITLQIPTSNTLSGFVWVYFPDGKVNISCNTHTMTTGESIIAEGETTPTTADVTGSELFPLFMVGPVVFVIAVVILACVIKKRRSTRSTKPPTSPTSSPTTPTEDHSSTHLLNPAYTDVNHHHHHHQQQQQQHENSTTTTSTTNNHHYHPHTHPPSYEDPTQLLASSSSTGGGADYAILQRQQGERVMATDGGGVNVYDHTWVCSEPYQSLNRDAPRQPVIDNVYYSTT